MLMTRLAAIAALAVACVFASGCATPARSDQMAISAAAVTRLTVPQALKGSIAIRDVTGGRETNPLWMSSVGSGEFERALTDSLRASGMLSPNRQDGAFLLTADLGKVDQPFMGFDMTVTTTVTYNLAERATGRNVFQQSLSTPYTARMSDAFLGVERLKLANEGSVRSNIERLIESLTRLRIDAAR